MDSQYQPQQIEQDCYAAWEAANYFAPQGNGQPYCIMLPPPNITGDLHMGHAFQQTLMDILSRYHRMRGDQTLWQCGTDHAGIATQMVVERQLEAAGDSRHAMGREAFIQRIWEWKARSGSNITRQSRRLGTSMDWSRERFTLDAGLSEAVTEVFLRLYAEGLIYRGKRLVNWDPILQTAVSDLEVNAVEEASSLWHIRYPLATPGTTDALIVATTRPETLFGDAAVAVHPDDERYQHLIGQLVQLPLCDRQIPIIADTYVSPEFGSGCVKITPAHDFNDYAVGVRHGLALQNILTPTAHLNDAVPTSYRGLERQEARKQVVASLESQGLLANTEAHTSMVPRGDRSNAVLEPYLTDQWYVKVQELAEPAIRAVEDGRIRFVPEHWSKTYFEWMHNIEDWCISRQLWWGHRIPAWYDTQGNIYVGRDEKAVREEYGLDAEIQLTQDPDVLDTWFSSALWPFSVLGWPKKNDELQKFYPSSVLVTGFDIIFFWVARMIMMGLKFMGEVPFREIYIHGLVRDGEGQKMSKSKGNILDPLDLIDGIELPQLIKKRTAGLMQPQLAPKIAADTRKHFPNGIDAYGTDALRFTFANLATQGREINFDVSRLQGYRNFCNKLWNAARFVLLNVEQASAANNGEMAIALRTDDQTLGIAEQWIQTTLSITIESITRSIENYRFDLAAQAIYHFIWDEYCDWYMELAKTTLHQPDSSAAEKSGTLNTLLTTLEILLRLLHPFMPFISESLWQKIAPLTGQNSKTIMLASYPTTALLPRNESILPQINWVKSFILGVRRIRAERDISPGKPMPVQYTGGNSIERNWLAANQRYIRLLAKTASISEQDGVADDTVAAVIGEMTILVPLSDLIDLPTECARMAQQLAKQLQQQQRLSNKLANVDFIQRAPAAIVAKERQKLSDLQSEGNKLQAQYSRLQRLLEDS